MVLLWTLACAVALPDSIEPTELYGIWVVSGSATERSLTLDSYDGEGWDHGYARSAAPEAGDEIQILDEGSWVLDGYTLSFRPDTDGASPWEAEVIGFEGDVLVLEEAGLSVRYGR